MVSQTTAKLYGSHARRFEACIVAGNGDLTSAEMWASALRELTRDVSRKSWRLYRNAIAWRLRSSVGEECAVTFMMLSAEDEKPEMKPRDLVRHVDPGVLETVVAALISRHGFLSKHVADLLLAMTTTGLRQSEFANARLSGTGPFVLVVKNAKFRPHTEGLPGRGNGEFRELILEADLPPALLASIRRTLAWCHGRPWSSMAPNVNRVFRSVINDLVRKRKIGTRWRKLRVYDCRHQFSADAKNNLGLLAGEVAAAMGHRSVITAASHYGKRRFGRSGTTFVRPSPASVEAVSGASREAMERTIAEDRQRRELKQSGTPKLEG